MVAVPFLKKKTRRATDTEVYAASQFKIQRDLKQLADIVESMPVELPTGMPRREAQVLALQARTRCERMLAALNEELSMFNNK